MDGEFIGLDVGGTKIASATLKDGKLTAHELVKTDISDSDALVAQLVELIGSCGATTRARSASGCPRSSSSRPAGSPTASTSRSPTCRCASC